MSRDSFLIIDNRIGAGKRGHDEVICNKKGLQFIKGGRCLYHEEHGQNAFVTSVRGSPDQAVIHIAGQVITVRFETKEECIQFIIAARAYAAYDKVCMIASLPPVNKEINPNVSIINALIQCGNAVEPYSWDPMPELEYTLPDIDEKEINNIAKAIQSLVADRRIKASTQACLCGMLDAISQGSVNAPLPKPQAWVEPESEDEPEEDPEEEAASIGIAPAVNAAGASAAVSAAGASAAVSDAEYEKRVVCIEDSCFMNREMLLMVLGLLVKMFMLIIRNYLTMVLRMVILIVKLLCLYSRNQSNHKRQLMKCIL